MCGFVQGLARNGVMWIFLLGNGCSPSTESVAPGVPDRSEGTATSSDISADEEVVFFPTAAHFDAANSQWIVPIHGIIYEPEQDSSEARSCRGVDSAGGGSRNRITGGSTAGRTGPAVPGRQ